MSVDQEALSISQLVSIMDKESSGHDDTETGRPSRSHWVQSFREIGHRPPPMSPSLRQDSLSYSLLFIHKQLKRLSRVRKSKGWGFQ